MEEQANNSPTDANHHITDQKKWSPEEKTKTSTQKDESKSISSHVPRYYLLRFDGGARGNPGPAGAGAALWTSDYSDPDPTDSENWILQQESVKFVGDNETNNTAEYAALQLGLEHTFSPIFKDHLRQFHTPAASKNEGKEEDQSTVPLYLWIQGDSRLVLMQVEGKWRTGRPHLQNRRNRIREILNDFETLCSRSNCTLRTVYQHIPRESNSYADKLANRAMDEDETATPKSSPSSSTCPVSGQKRVRFSANNDENPKKETTKQDTSHHAKRQKEGSTESK